jgi:plasmid stabilization system protein ParE
MAYRVSFARRAVRDLDRLYDSINAAESDAAVRWFLKLQETIGLLASSPHMGALTHKDASRRQLVYGNKPHLYRVIYKLDDDASIVIVLQIRHGKRAREVQ